MALYPAEYYLLDVCSGGGMLGEAIRFALDGRLRTVAYVERESSAAACLVARMEDEALDRAPIWDDVNTATGSEFLGYMEGFSPLILCAGYPCQPFSVAGRRRGEADSRHLWPAIYCLVTELKPECVFLENVPGHLKLGFGTVKRNLETIGYHVEAGLFTAEEVGASHKRERLFILALGNTGYNGCAGQGKQCKNQRSEFGATGGGVGNTRGFGGKSRWPECNGQQGQSETDNASGVVANSGGGQFQNAQRGEKGRAGFDGAGPIMADTYRLNADGGGHESDSICGQQSGQAGLCGSEYLADTGGSQLSERESERRNNGAEFQAAARGGGLPLFAPGPGEFDAWERILLENPDVEPAIRGLPARLAAGVVQPRRLLTGNGVVPLAAAYAFISLAALFPAAEGNVNDR